MVLKLGTACCLHLSPPLGTCCPPFTTSLSRSRRCRSAAPVVSLADRTAFLGWSGATKLFTSRSLGDTTQLIRRTTSSASSCSSSSDSSGFFQDDYSEDEEARTGVGGRAGEDVDDEEDEDVSGEMVAAAFLSPSRTPDESSSLRTRASKTPELSSSSVVDVAPPKWVAIPRMLPMWQQPNATGSRSLSDSSSPPATIPMKKPLFPQQTQLPPRLDDGVPVAAAGEAMMPCCSVKRAFSSVVFIIRELHSHTLQLREVLFGDQEVHLDRVLGKVQAEVHASFCWLFQQIFSCTPTLMVSVMLLLANFTVYSMAAGGIGAGAARASALPSSSRAVQAPVQVSFEYSLGDIRDVDQQSKQLPQQQQQQQQEDQMMTRKSNGEGGGVLPSSLKTFSFGTSSPAATPGGGHNDGGGGRVSRPVAGATDDSHDNRSSNTNGEQHSSRYDLTEEDAQAWRRIQDEATRLQSNLITDPDTLRCLVAPLSLADLDFPSDSDVPVVEYMRTELEYRVAVESSPDNPLLLANYAQFLFLVARDHDRAEHYFKRATAVQPHDAESLARYADFLWLARNDICAAEETYLQAIEADPGNACYAASYAHFLWNTGGEDTCFPLGDQNYCQQDGEEDDDQVQGAADQCHDTS